MPEVTKEGFMPTRCLRFTLQPRDHVYRCILRAAVQGASTAYLIVTDSMGLSTGGSDCLSTLRPHLVSEQLVSEWPGTKLHSGQARMLTYQLNSSFLQVIEQYSEGLYDWIQPDLPEDLGFLRSDGSVWLASIAHEADAWLEVDDKEFAEILEACPEIAPIVEQE